MAPLVQNTFSVVPDAPSALNNQTNGENTSIRMAKPPMTSKQVKKAYQKATKQPKLSKAERRRQELFEQDRIRKETEKERNQARARAARDKKREKVERERAEKKNKGLPLVEVRPSQDTLARFVRARPSNAALRDVSASPSVATEDERDEGDSGLSSLGNASQSSHRAQWVDDSNKENVAPRSKRSPRPSLPARWGLVDNGVQSSSCKPATVFAEPPNKKRKVAVPEEADQQSALDVYDDAFAMDFSEEELLEDLCRADDVHADDVHSDGVHANDVRADNAHADDLYRTPTASNNGMSKKQRDHDTSIEMPPPKLPEKRSPVRENRLPPSTQLFFLNHLDDFFPSPSQEVREIFEEPERKVNRIRNKTASTDVQILTSSTIRKEFHVQHFAKPPKPRAVTAQPTLNTIPPKQQDTFEMPFFCTQDLLMSSQDVKDIEETSQPQPSPKVSTPIPSPQPESQRPSRPSPKPFLSPSNREMRLKYAIECSKTAAWEGPRAQQKAREVLERLQAEEDNHTFLASSGENTKESRRETPAASFATKTDTPAKESHTTISRSAPKSQAQPRPVRPDPRRNTRPKSSYETMLELLAKQKQSGTNKNKAENKIRTGGVEKQVAKELPASQETDYGGEEWDDDELLRDLL